MDVGSDCSDVVVSKSASVVLTDCSVDEVSLSVDELLNSVDELLNSVDENSVVESLVDSSPEQIFKIKFCHCSKKTKSLFSIILEEKLLVELEEDSSVLDDVSIDD